MLPSEPVQFSEHALTDRIELERRIAALERDVIRMCHQVEELTHRLDTLMNRMLMLFVAALTSLAVNVVSAIVITQIVGK
jgi:hypothetical protein